MQSLRHKMAAVICLVCACAGIAGAVTIYVNAAQPPPGSGTLADPYTAITSAVARLATENAIVKGGHIISVAPGTYTNQVDLGIAHAGTNGAPNTIIATNRALVISAGYAFYLYNAHYVTIDGFDITGAGYSPYEGAIQLYSTNGYDVIRNCNIYANNRNGIRTTGLGGYRNKILVQNCNIYGNLFGGISTYNCDDNTVVNCNIIGNSTFGCDNSHTTDNYYMSNNVFYANAIGNYGGTGEGAYRPICDTAVAINALPNCANNIVANPGFARLSSGWNFNCLYENSPCLNSGVGGVDIGAHQDPPLVGISTNTYYVNGSTGSDGNSIAQAQNPATPWLTIGKAAREAVASNTVVVAAGTYNEQVVITNSGSANAPVVFRANGEVTVVGTATAFDLDRVLEVTLDGFKCRGASIAGVRLRSGAMHTLTNLVAFTNAGCGILVVTQSCRNVISGSAVYSNGSYGISFYAAGSASSIDRCRIHHNANNGIDLYNSWRFTIGNCEINANNGKGVCLTASTDFGGNRRPFTRLLNCTIYGNGGTGIHLNHWTTGSAENCIISSNKLYGMFFSQLTLASMNTTNCCFYDHKGTNLYRDVNFVPHVLDTEAELNSQAGWANVIVRDPVFFDGPGGDLRLRFRPKSNCIDAGTLTNSTPADLYGQPRLSGPAVDMGSYEYQYPLRGTIISIY